MMNAIELMMDEHRTIERMLAVIRKYCQKILDHEEVDYNVFYELIDFVRTYADDHHHGKEEAFLFKAMQQELGVPGQKLVQNGMLVEHDLGRLYTRELEEAVARVLSGDDSSKLDVIAHAIGYTHLLARHIFKEDNVAYTLANNKLSNEALAELERSCMEFEAEAAKKQIQEHYLQLLERHERNVMAK